MFVRELKVGLWYYYHSGCYHSPLLAKYLMFYEGHRKLWRFVSLGHNTSFFVNLTRREVNAIIDPTHPTLSQYLSLFNADEWN